MITVILVVVGAAVGVAVAEGVRRQRYAQRLETAPRDDLEAPVKLRSLEAASAVQSRCHTPEVPDDPGEPEAPDQPTAGPPPSLPPRSPRPTNPRIAVAR